MLKKLEKYSSGFDNTHDLITPKLGGFLERIHRPYGDIFYALNNRVADSPGRM